MKKVIFHPLTLIIFLLISGFFSFSMYQTVQKTQSSEQNLNKLEEEVGKMEQEVQQLENQLGESQSAYTQEKMIRDELLMQKPGEYVVQIPDLPDQTQQMTSIESDQSVWQQWQELLF